MPCVLVDDPDRQPEMRISARIQVLDEQIAATQEFDHPFEQQVELIGIEGEVRITPVHLVGGNGVLYGKFVFGRSARVFAGVGDQGAVVRQLALVASNGVFHQRTGA